MLASGCRTDANNRSGKIIILLSKCEPQGQLKRSRVSDSRRLAKTGRWRYRVYSGAERAVRDHVVAVIKGVERFGDSLQPGAPANLERAAQSGVQIARA